jgi:hypothetical protein
MSVHDLIFAVGAGVILVSMLPAMKHKSQLPYGTIIPTGVVILIFAVNYGSMHFWYAAGVEAANVVCWCVLLWYRLSIHTQGEV